MNPTVAGPRRDRSTTMVTVLARIEELGLELLEVRRLPRQVILAGKRR